MTKSASAHVRFWGRPARKCRYRLVELRSDRRSISSVIPFGVTASGYCRRAICP